MEGEMRMLTKLYIGKLEGEKLFGRLTWKNKVKIDFKEHRLG
jgi:hypothetical protein